MPAFPGLVCLLAMIPALALPQATGRSVKPFLEVPVQSPEGTEYQLRQFIVQRIPKLEAPKTAEA
jgi:hypothetical protein